MASNVRDSFENIEVYKKVYLLPDKETSPNANGAWRIHVNSDGDLVFEKLESGSWVQKGSWTA